MPKRSGFAERLEAQRKRDADAVMVAKSVIAECEACAAVVDRAADAAELEARDGGCAALAALWASKELREAARAIRARHGRGA